VSTIADSLVSLSALPGVAEATAAARRACTQLRWHEALRPTWARWRHTERARRKASRCGSHTVLRPSWPGLTKAVASQTRSSSVALP